GEPLPGATVRVKGTEKAAAAGADGKFSLTGVEENAVLVVSSVGFVTQEVPLNGRTQLTVVLEEDLARLNEVVVVGYGTQQRSDVTSAISTFKPTEENNRPVLGP